MWNKEDIRELKEVIDGSEITPNFSHKQVRGSNNKVMGYFLIHRVLNFFASHFEHKIEEREATTFLLGEVRSLQKVEVFDKVTLDYDLVYVMFDIFHAIGVINRVNENGQLFMRWLGYSGLLTQFNKLFRAERSDQLAKGRPAIPASKKHVLHQHPLLKPKIPYHHRTGPKSQKVHKGSIIEEFSSHILGLLYRRKQMTGEEYKEQCGKILFDDCTVKQTELRNKIRKVFVKILVILRICSQEIKVQEEASLPPKQATTIEPSSQFPEKSIIHQKILTWTLSSLGGKDPINFENLDEEKTLNELIEKTEIVFKREPAKATIENFKVKACFAMLKGKDWEYGISQFVTIIGKLSQNPQQYYWQVDLDLGHASQISRQHAAILYNFESQCFELKVLSKKYPVYINGEKFTFEDQPVALKMKDRVSMGLKETFYFLLPLQTLSQSSDSKY